MTLARRFLVTFAALLFAASASATPLGTAFTYQGRMDKNGVALSDTYGFIFRLYDAASGGAQIGSDQIVNGVVATNGLFSVTLDFGASPFAGEGRWLDIQVRGSADANYTALTPRQPIAAVPYALYALNGAGGGGGPWVGSAGDLTYSGAGVGFLGASSPFASGKGVFIEGGNASAGNVFAFNYDTFQPLSLCFNTPGGSVAVGTSAPAAKFDVAGSTLGLGIRATMSGSIVNSTNAAIQGIGNTGSGIIGTSAIGIYGSSTDNIGVFGASASWDGVMGQSAGNGRTGVWGVSYNAGGYGGVFQNNAGGVALFSNGLAQIKTLQILGGADLAERFDSDVQAEPGTVMAIDAASPGRVRIAEGAYSHTVAGVVSGANGLSAGVELSKDDRREGVALALTGRVWVKCDASSAPIRPGDLLTTAARAGYAMRADDRDRSQGAILGKAMTSLEHGTGLVLVLVSLQ